LDGHGYTPLYEAARLGHLKVCELLIKNTRDKNPFTDYGESALYADAIGGYSEICKLIVCNIDDKNPRHIKRNAGYSNDGGTSLHGAEARGHTNIYR
jgi:ankyrin repeat protein